MHISREKEEKRKKGTLRHERYEEIVRCFTRDGGRSCETGRQVQVSNYLKLLWAKAMVVSVEEKAYWIGQVWITKVSAKRTNVRIESLAGVKIGGVSLLQEQSRGNLCPASVAPGVQLARA